MNKFLNWYGENRAQITWWVIGWLSFAVIDSLIKKDYMMALVNAGLVYINYYMWKNRT